jgi:hypothetical protein
MPADQIPTLQSYLARVGVDGALERIREGLARSLVIHCSPDSHLAHGYCGYLAVYAGAALLVAALNMGVMWAALRRNGWLVLFCVGFIVVNTVSAAWWMRLTPYGVRFLLALLLPALWCLASILTLPGLRPLHVPLPGGRRVPFVTLLHLGLLAALAVDIVFIVTSRVTWMYGGD